MDRRYSLNDGLELWTSPESPERSLGGESSNIWGLLLNIVLYTIASLQLWVSWQFEWFHATAFSIPCFYNVLHKIEACLFVDRPKERHKGQ